MKLLDPSNYPLVRPLVKHRHLAFVLEAMIAGNSPAVMYVDNAAQPGTVLLWDKSHSVYLGGNTSNETLAQFITDEWLPLVQHLGIFIVHPADETWDKLTANLFPNITLTRRERVFFADGDFNVAGWQKRVPAGFRMQMIDEALLTNPAVKRANLVTEEIESCWNDISQFYTDGFGFCLVTDDDEIAAWCTAEYRSAGKCGIGIETYEPFMKRGFATLTASAFVEHCRAQSIIPHWDSWATNTASVATAERIGFHRAQDYVVHLARFEPI